MSKHAAVKGEGLCDHATNNGEILMNAMIRNGVAVALLSSAALAFYLAEQSPKWLLRPAVPELTGTDAPPAASVPAEPAIRYPIARSDSLQDGQTASTPLPSLNESDPSMGAAITGLVVSTPLKDLFRLQDVVRNIVVTIDNLPRESLAMRQLPVKPASGSLAIEGAGEDLAIAARNRERYTPYIRLAKAIDAREMVATYVQLYPLFQRAYQELGYPKGYFNDRLILVIDHLLAAPEIDGPIALTQPHVLYRFADSELEARSAGHKVMIRMGRENAAVLKAKLVEIRRELTGEAVPR